MSIGYLAIPHVSKGVLSASCVAMAVVGAVCYLVAHRLNETEKHQRGDRLVAECTDIETNPVGNSTDK